MEGRRSPHTSGNPGHASRAAVSLLLPLICALLVSSADAAEEESKPVWTVWKVHEVGFSYRSSVAFYSCDELQNRVAVILRAIGARDDLSVSVSNCDIFGTSAAETRAVWPGSSDDSFDRRLNRDRTIDSRQRIERNQFASVRIRAMMPVVVTPEIVAELERDKSRRELVSRVTGDPAASRDVPVMFPARPQEITLSHANIGLEPEECELLEQMSTGVMKQLNVRVVRRPRACDPRRVSRIPPQLTVEALVGVPSDLRLPSLAPAAGEKDPDPAPEASGTEPPAPATEVPPK